MKKRFEDIDFLRGVAILAIIATHVYGLHLGNERDFVIWNWLHFAVPGFLFCSGFVLSASLSNPFTSLGSTARWFRKRFLRLLVPFYVYFFVHFLLFLLFPKIFNNFQFDRSFEFIINSLLFTGNGISLSWLPILFIELTLLFPLLSYFQKKGILFYVNSLVLILISLITISQMRIPFQSASHWVFWLFPFILGMLFTKLTEAKRRVAFISGSLICIPLFLFLYFVFSSTGRSLVLTHHKYPPDLFYISFALGVEFLILFMSVYLLRITLLKKSILFLSKNSYGIFFLHYIVLDLVYSFNSIFALDQSPITQTIIVLCVTGFGVTLWNKKFLLLERKKTKQ